ncbi:MAG TPA: MFS transporter [Flavitalea sp.]|nr:MFS transporter [Flavitalea sp.]
MKRNYYIVGLIMLIFFIISFLTNIIGPLVPDIIKGFNLSLTLVAVLPLAFFIAYGVMSIPAGILIEKHGEKKVILAAFMLAFLGALMLSLTPNYLTAAASLFLIGCGMAMLQVAINPLLRVAGGEEHFAFNSVMAQLIFGLASFVSPLVYSYLALNLKAGGGSGPFLSILSALTPPALPWIAMYWVFALICLAMILIVFASRFPKVERSKEEESSGSLKMYLTLLKNRTAILFFLGIFCYVGSEQGIANWVSQYLSVYYGYDPQTTGAQTVAYFWGLMTAGGVIGLLLLKIMDSRKVLIGFTALAIISLTIALFSSPAAALIAFPMTGFFAAVMYPIIFSLALNSLKDHHGSYSGILLTGIIGGALAPITIGWIGDKWGLQTGMLLIYVTLAYILSIGFWARPFITNKTVSLSFFKRKTSA